MATEKQPSGNIDRAANVIENQADAKEAHMLKFYYSGAPNPTKVALFLEETGTPYEPIPIDTRKGEQHKSEFLAINPNAKLPAIVEGDVTVLIRALSYFISQRRPANFCPLRPTKHARNSCHGCFSCRLVSALISGSQCISETLRPKRSLTPSIVMCLKHSDTPAFSMHALASRNTCWATPTRSLI